MISTLHIATSIERQLDNLQKSGKKGALAVRQYEQIIIQFQDGNFSSLPLKNKRTKHGELRLQNCIKYDLGCGYRLITIKKGADLYIPLLGHHDEVDLWLEKKRTLPVEWEVLQCNCSTQQEDSSCSQPTMECQVTEHTETIDIYEDQLLEKVNESNLQEIFCGLFSNKQQ